MGKGNTGLSNQGGGSLYGTNGSGGKIQSATNSSNGSAPTQEQQSQAPSPTSSKLTSSWNAFTNAASAVAGKAKAAITGKSDYSTPSPK
jgi:hypothetical protein